MPTYEFRCPDGTIVEKIFKISEAPDEIPSPKGDGMAKRIISGGAALLFKGSGFYITDYGKDGKKDQRAAVEQSSSGYTGSHADKSSPSKSESVSQASAGSSGGSDTKSSDAKPSSSAPPTSSSTPTSKD